MRLLLLYIDGLVRDCNNAIANALELFVADTKYAEHTMHQCQIPSTSDDEKRNFFYRWTDRVYIFLTLAFITKYLI